MSSPSHRSLACRYLYGRFNADAVGLVLQCIRGSTVPGLVTRERVNSLFPRRAYRGDPSDAGIALLTVRRQEGIAA